MTKIACLAMAGAICISAFSLYYLYASHRRKRCISRFHISKQDLIRITNAITKEFKFPATATVMLPSFVDKFPSGKEKGLFLAIDLGGTNFRVDLVSLSGSESTSILCSRTTPIPLHIKGGTGAVLFDFIANEIFIFCADLKQADILVTFPLATGFTFSFPLEQQSITSGKILQWNKDYRCEDAVGSSPVALLEQALEKRNATDLVNITILLNDTVATALAGKYFRKETQIGLILGTGANASLFTNDSIINTEFGSLDVVDDIRTEDDIIVDEGSSTNPGKQKLEKMISGQYLGEIAYSFLSSCKELRTGTMLPQSAIDLDTVERNPSNYDPIIVEASHSISTRSAKLVACVISALVGYAGISGPVVVAVDGSLFEKFYMYKERIESALSMLLDRPVSQIQLFHCQKGSSIGAAVGAALYAPTSA